MTSARPGLAEGNVGLPRYNSLPSAGPGLSEATPKAISLSRWGGARGFSSFPLAPNHCHSKGKEPLVEKAICEVSGISSDGRSHRGVVRPGKRAVLRLGLLPKLAVSLGEKAHLGGGIAGGGPRMWRFGWQGSNRCQTSRCTHQPLAHLSLTPDQLLRRSRRLRGMGAVRSNGQIRLGRVLMKRLIAAAAIVVGLGISGGAMTAEAHPNGTWHSHNQSVPVYRNQYGQIVYYTCSQLWHPSGYVANEVCYYWT